MAIGRALRFVLFLGILAMAGSSQLRADALDEAFLKFPTGSQNRGFGIALFDGKGELWSRYVGWANEETAVPFSRDTIFRVGAVSDLFTVMLALRAVDAGLMDPERPIAAYLPDLFSGAAPGSPRDQVGRLKVRILMSHLSGTDANFFLNYLDYDPSVNIGAYLQDVALKYPPGAKVVRSGAMIDLLGLALAKLAGKPFDDLARTALFEPLGMKASSFRYRDSPLFASLRYKSAAPDTYATRLPGFREVVAPSGSMQSSIRDLVTAYSALLRTGPDPGPRPLSGPALAAMFSTQNEAAAQRQGLRTGYGWKLSLPELGYLGQLAWYSGKHLSHRNVVILLPRLGVGVVCATNAWHIFDWDTILPMAVEVLKAYARTALDRPEPAPLAAAGTALPSGLQSQLAGLYASACGVYRIDPEPSGMRMTSTAQEGRLAYVGQGSFQAGPDGPVAKVTATPPDALSLWLRNGLVIAARKCRPGPDADTWLKRLGTYRIVKAKPGALFAVTLSSFEGLPVISGDDGMELQLEPLTGGRATVTCNESSRFFGKELRSSGDQGLLIDGLPYTRGTPANEY